ncbi:MAG: hypothetical protein ACI3XY_00295 [Butyricicoccaceae bacterium]
MRIYYALTTYHILCCVLHCMTHPTEHKTVLLLSDIHKNSVAFIGRYRSSGIFDDIFLLAEGEVMDLSRSLERHSVPVSVTLKICCHQMKKRLPVPVTAQDELYLCPDHFPFGWMVVTSKLPYNCFEEGCGVLSDREFALSNMCRNKTQRRLYDVLGLFGDNNCAQQIFADVNRQKTGYQNDKMTDFSVVRILEHLKQQELDRVLAFFGCKRKAVLAPAGLILTQHLANLGLMPLEEQHRLYTLFADVFLQDKAIVIKPHPDDIAGCYDEIFHGKATVLPFAMPSELLPFCANVVFDKAIAAYSTAVRTLGGSAKCAVSFDNRILSDYRHLVRYDAVSQLLRELDVHTAETDANELLLGELCGETCAFLPLEGSAECCVISDRLDKTVFDKLRTVKAILQRERGTVIFLNEEEQYLYFDGEDTSVFCRVRPLLLDYSDGSGEVIYVYSSSDEMLERVNRMNSRKELKYTGLTVDIHGISESERDKLRVLEGVLAATERRLKDYIAHAKEE